MRATVAAVALLGVLALSGCSNDAKDAAAAAAPFGVPTSAVPAPTTAPAVTPEQEELLGPHIELPGGLLLKQIGKVAQATPASSPPGTLDVNVWAWRLIV